MAILDKIFGKGSLGRLKNGLKDVWDGQKYSAAGGVDALKASTRIGAGAVGVAGTAVGTGVVFNAVGDTTLDAAGYQDGEPNFLQRGWNAVKRTAGAVKDQVTGGSKTSDTPAPNPSWLGGGIFAAIAAGVTLLFGGTGAAPYAAGAALLAGAVGVFVGESVLGKGQQKVDELTATQTPPKEPAANAGAGAAVEQEQPSPSDITQYNNNLPNNPIAANKRAAAAPPRA